jgi:hypothetical protein
MPTKGQKIGNILFLESTIIFIQIWKSSTSDRNV